MNGCDFRRMCCLINAFGRFGRESCKKRCYKKDVRSRYVYENKGRYDTLPGKKSDIYVFHSDIFV